MIWQNRATRFYLGARSCYLNGLLAPALHNAFIALELLLKATLVYHDKSFRERDFGHNLRKLTKAIRNKVPGARTFTLPPRYTVDNRFVNVSRYPDGRGLVLPSTFLPDLDRAFYSLLVLTPFQFNTELKRHLRRRNGTERLALVRSNLHTRKMRFFLQVKQTPQP